MKKRFVLMILTVALLVTCVPSVAQENPIEESEYPQVSAKSDTAPPLPKATGEEIEEPIVEEEDATLPEPDSEITIHEESIKLHNATLGQPFTDNEKLARQAILTGIMQHEEGIDIREYKITKHDLEAIIEDLHDSESCTYRIENRYRFSFSGSYIYVFYPIYRMDEAECAAASEFIDGELAKILENSGALLVEDDYQQALLLNDYIVSHYEYDTTYTNYDMYSMLRDKKGVCQAYTLLYDELLTRVGIEVTYAESDAMNHVWNLVKIGEFYYHVDVTWNDPISDRYGMARHSYFMLSDAAFLNNPNGSSHHDWISYDNIRCRDTTYDNSIVTSSILPFVTDGYDLFYIESESKEVCRYVDAFTKGDILYKINEQWRTADDRGYYMDAYSGLVCFEGKLYFNTPKSVVMYDLQNDEVSSVLTLTEEEDIIALRYEGERTITYALAADPNSPISEFRTYRIPEAVTYHPCDVNLDSVVNIDDVNCLLIYLAGIDGNDGWHYDVNDDGIVNIDDLNTLLIELSTKE